MTFEVGKEFFQITEAPATPEKKTMHWLTSKSKFSTHQKIPLRK